MCLNHPQTTPTPPVHEKIVFHKTGPWCQKGRGPTRYRIIAVVLKGGQRMGDKDILGVKTGVGEGYLHVMSMSLSVPQDIRQIPQQRAKEQRPRIQ